MRNVVMTALAMVALTLVGCSPGVADLAPIGSALLSSADDSVGAVPADLAVGVPDGTVLGTTATVNLRTAPSPTAPVRLVMPAGAQVTVLNGGVPVNGFFNVAYHNVAGWVSGAYVALVSLGVVPAGPEEGDPAPVSTDPGPTTPPAVDAGTPVTSAPDAGSTTPGGTTTPGTTTPGTPPPTARQLAITRAQSGVGFSYWWGHGRWLPGGLSSSTAGSCTGNCPSCTHSGGYGADCSGYVGKIWQVGTNNSDPTVDKHPYSTLDFLAANSQWNQVDRGAVQPADALVYNTNGSGHIFLYESGDGWGSMWAYEAKGCATGILHDLRTASAAYRAIHRTGY